MTAIDVADLVVIAGHVLGISPGAALDQLDIAAADAALAEAGPAAAELAGAEADAALAAAVLMQALLRHRPFASQGQHGHAHGHAQQVAVAAGLQFLALNGWQADLDPPGAARIVLAGLASGRLSPADAAAWLSPRLSAYSAAPPTKEAPMRTRLRGLLSVVDPRPVAGIRTPVTGFVPFTDDASAVVVQARAEADRIGRGRPGPAQFLLALADTGRGVAARALKRLAITPEAVRQQVTHQPPVPPAPDITLAMEVMPRALGEAMAHARDRIGSEHILLALFHAGDDTAARALANLGAGERAVRAAITAVAGNPGPVPAHHRGRKSDEIRQLRCEVARLSHLLREHGIEPRTEPATEPGEGDRQSA